MVWDHFVKMKNVDGSLRKPGRAKCKYYPQTYTSDSRSNGTSTMKDHVTLQCRKSPVYVRSKRQRKLSFEPTEKGGNLVAIAFENKTSKLACARMVVRDELPFSFVENEGFREFMRVTQQHTE
ncbi:hypothetical protein ACLB2K_072597 [Fragaria x ananassa]